MKIMSKAERQKVRKEYIEYRNKEFKAVAKEVGKEYCKIGAGVVNELGFLFTGVRATAAKKRR
ncbi:hypothetical protein [Roseovarius rhodophyticola]|uniref:Uncharacterized protein n=1 Tax=Roseovarius rhodophyticola TaxID=3080827 RepID=A0ABZ2TJH4_9RHOB|nr:hypothetical protein [Roseovarius sp. W115]MDV2930183.1 hypothetical protein [Roseovarius sp. W115]